jgi:amidase
VYAPGGDTVRLAPTGRGVLDGLTFAVKDNIDVAGSVSGAGNPDWRAGSPPAVDSAPCVQALLAAGASLAGRTISDELAFSLEGRNTWDGTPVNPAVPDGLPGGSSSGSAVAVACGAVDFALGTDTGGSVRVPASFCGIYGFRPSHGRVPLTGVVPLAPSYDTVGWFARSAELLARVGSVLTGGSVNAPVRQVVVAEDAFALMTVVDRAALLAAVPAGASSCQVFGGDPGEWLECYRVVQGFEIWRGLGAWIERTRPRFAPDIAARFADAAGITQPTFEAMLPARARLASYARALVPVGTALVMPSAPGSALRMDVSGEAVGAFYRSALALTSVAGHAGLPQVSVPVAGARGPLGLSIVGWAGGDAAVLAMAAAVSG